MARDPDCPRCGKGLNIVHNTQGCPDCEGSRDDCRLCRAFLRYNDIDARPQPFMPDSVLYETGTIVLVPSERRPGSVLAFTKEHTLRFFRDAEIDRIVDHVIRNVGHRLNFDFGLESFPCHRHCHIRESS